MIRPLRHLAAGWKPQAPTSGLGGNIQEMGQQDDMAVTVFANMGGERVDGDGYGSIVVALRDAMEESGEVRINYLPIVSFGALF